jgi:hypothetical protein
MSGRIVRWGPATAAAVTVVVGTVVALENEAAAGSPPGGSPAPAQESTQLPASTAAGQFDAGLGGDGKVLTDLTAKQDSAWALAIQADGKTVAPGYGGWSSKTDMQIAIARYLAQ